MSAGDPAKRSRFGGLFLRIYLTFLATVVAFVMVSTVAIFAVAQHFGPQWADEIVTHIGDQEGSLVAALAAGPDAVREREKELSERLDAEIRVIPFRRRGDMKQGRREKAAGRRPAPRPPHNLNREQRRRLRKGKPVFRHKRFGPPTIAVPLRGEDEAVAGIVHVEPAHGGFGRRLGLGALAFLSALGLGAWPLARSLSGRLRRLETSTLKFADGDLAHRAFAAEPARDEIDQLSHAFNDMAGRIHGLMTGQRTLLTNVSHELRTPIARMRVLAEILEERVDSLAEKTEADDPNLTRLRRGLGEMQEDLSEIESLISDLLASGRLELGKDGGLELSPVVVRDLLGRVCARFGAELRCSPGLELEADALLMERLLANLLTNARRACPEGEIVVAARVDDQTLVIDVEDEGPGVAPERRAEIFEPFTRLDGARSRDRGGVGLGLYLCRQIALAHGGTIACEGRRDDRPGARFIVRIPT